LGSFPVVYTAPDLRAPRAPLPLRKKALFTAAIGVVGLLTIELAARVLVPAPLEWREHPSRILQFDAVRGWSLRPNAQDFTVDKPVRVNAAGFRDREFPVARAPGVARIACVGDSYTYGWGVELDASYPKQLERRLGGQAPSRCSTSESSATTRSRLSTRSARARCPTSPTSCSTPSTGTTSCPCAPSC